MYGATACSAGAIGVDARMPTDDVIATPTCAATKYVAVTCPAQTESGKASGTDQPEVRDRRPSKQQHRT